MHYSLRGDIWTVILKFTLKRLRLQLMMCLINHSCFVNSLFDLWNVTTVQNLAANSHKYKESVWHLLLGKWVKPLTNYRSSFLLIDLSINGLIVSTPNIYSIAACKRERSDIYEVFLSSRSIDFPKKHTKGTNSTLLRQDFPLAVDRVEFPLWRLGFWGFVLLEVEAVLLFGLLSLSVSVGAAVSHSSAWFLTPSSEGRMGMRLEVTDKV